MLLKMSEAENKAPIGTMLLSHLSKVICTQYIISLEGKLATAGGANLNIVQAVQQVGGAGQDAGAHGRKSQVKRRKEDWTICYMSACQSVNGGNGWATC